MSPGHHRITWRRNIAENFNRLSRVHERYSQATDRQTTDRQTDGRRHIANMNMSSRSLKIHEQLGYVHFIWFTDEKVGLIQVSMPNRPWSIASIRAGCIKKETGCTRASAAVTFDLQQVSGGVRDCILVGANRSHIRQCWREDWWSTTHLRPSWGDFARYK